MSSSKTIAKNTLFLYFRMFLIMGVTLYTSRVVLQQLGVSDFGIYSLVGGIVAMLGFFNAAMSSATQRYLSFDIGKGDLERLQKTFSATLTIHILIAVLALVLAETLGLWYINYKMVFPEDRLYAVNIVYQFSVLTFLLNIIQVPYNSLILARERMSVYAYVSILEAVLKLAIVFLLVFGEDKLKLYAILTFVVAFIIRLIYQIYCRKQFEESKYHFEYDKVYFGELFSYSGWNLFGSIAAVSKGQGVNIILNLFFGVIVNAAYGITMQIQGAILMFVNSFQMAFNPQIVKLYAKEELENMTKLIYVSSKFSVYLLLLLVLPVFISIEYILQIWLGTFPDLVVDFVRLTLVSIILDSISGPLVMASQATGKIKWYQIIVGGLLFMNLPFSYFLVKSFNDPIFAFYVLITMSLICLVARLFFLRKMIDLDIKCYIKKVLWPIILVVFFIGIPVKYVYSLGGLKSNDFISFVKNVLLIVCYSILVMVIIGINKKEKNQITSLIKNKIIKG